MKNKIKIFIVFIVLLFCTSVYGVSEVLLGQAGQPIYTLTVTGSGSGTGIITSNIYGINCTSTAGTESGVCLALIPMGTTVILTATPIVDNMFGGWIGGGCAGVGACSVLIDGDKIIDANFIIAPQNANLIAWYKFDEGSGAVVFNRAVDGSSGGGLLPNLTVFNTFAGSFWTYRAGFGSTPQLYNGAGVGADFAWSKPNRTIGGVNEMTMGIFVRRIPDYGMKGGYIVASRSLPTAGIEGHKLFTCNPVATQGYQWQWASGLVFVYDASLIDVWLFHFLDSNGKYRIVKPDGTILTSATATNLASVRQYIYAFAGVSYVDADPPTIGYYPGGGSYGDWIVYDQKTLTLAEWAMWYDQLRLRYGMAARSGW